jgi:hypothetical protein
MLRWKAVLLVASAAVLTGCAGVVSLHPVAAAHVADPNLEGQWRETKADSDGGYTVYSVAREAAGYKVSASTVKLEGTMRVLRAGDQYLLEVRCPSDGPSPPVYVFLRVRLEGNSLWAAEMQSDWLKEQISSGGKLRHEVVDGNKVVLTASPDELRRFLLPFAADKRAFDDETELRRLPEMKQTQ